MSCNSKMVMTALAALALISLPHTDARAGVVVAATGPSAQSFPVGRKLADTDRVVLQTGDTLTILDAKGTRVLRGAGSFVLGQRAGPDKSATLAILTRQRSAQRMRTGAVRAVTDDRPVTSPNLWYVDVRQSSTMCLANPSEVRLWRPGSEGVDVYTVAPEGAPGSVPATFPEGEMLAVWNVGEAPIVDGSKFVISIGDERSGSVTFRLLDAVPDDPEELVAKLIDMGCSAQVEQLVAATMIADS